MHPFCVSREGIPGYATGIDDRIVIVEHAVRKKMLAKVQPNALYFYNVTLGTPSWIMQIQLM